MVHVVLQRDFEQVKYEMLQVRYVDPGDGSDPTVLGTTDGSTHIQCIRNPVLNEPVIGTVDGELYDLLPGQCVLRLVECPVLFGMYWMYF